MNGAVQYWRCGAPSMGKNPPAEATVRLGFDKPGLQAFGCSNPSARAGVAGSPNQPRERYFSAARVGLTFGYFAIRPACSGVFLTKMWATVSA
jgi:hypothetical protein